MKKNNRIAFIDTIYPINTRTRRFLDTFKKEGNEFCIIAWDRSGLNFEGKNDFIYSTKTGYGNKLKKLFGIFGFVIHTRRILSHSNYNVVFCSEWDSLLVFYLSSLFMDKKFKVIYDCIDLPTSQNQVVLLALKSLEWGLTRNIDAILYASRYFIEQYTLDCRSLVIENYPTQAQIDIINDKELVTLNEDIFSVTWLGIVRYRFTLERLIDSIHLLNKQGVKIKLDIYGDGPDLGHLKHYVKEKTLEECVFFHGRYKPEQIASIYQESDAIWAAYPTLDHNVKSAISNKYHECLSFHKPILVSSKTKMADNAPENTSLYAVDETDVQDISQKLRNLMKKGDFIPYDKAIIWEDVESEFLNLVRDL